MSKLILCSLPIGNAQDITLRAVKCLKEARCLLAEDTRNFVQLLRHLEISTDNKDIDSFHDHSSAKLQALVKKIHRGQEIVLVSDAGSPIISDPAFPLVRACLEAGISIESVPGVSSVIVALELSGLPPHPFHFHGFLARDDQGKRVSFEHARSIKGTHLFFESPHRLEKSLELLESIAPDSDVYLGRELTKSFESHYRFKSGQWREAEIMVKGEFVMAINFSAVEAIEDKSLSELKNLAHDYTIHGGGPKKLAKLLALILERNPKDIYKDLLAQKGK